MKVLHINWSGDLGGAENFAYELAKRQFVGVKRLAPTIAYMSRKSVLGTKAEQEGMRIVEFNMRSGFDIFNFKRYLSFIKGEKFDIIHDHNGPPLVRLSKIWSPHSIFIQHIHGPKITPTRWESPRVLWWKRITSRLVDWYIANSNYTKEVAMRKEKISKSLISVVYNGIDIDKFVGASRRLAPTIREEFGIKNDEWVVGIVGNLVPAKGIDKFIQVANKVDNAKFVIVGEGELRSKLEHLVKSLKLNGKVLLIGARDDIPNILSMLDVLLLTSNWETFGIILVEAMASGIPVIAFNVGGVAEVVPEDCGMLIPPDISKAVESIFFLRNNPEIAKKMGTAGIRWAIEKFDIKKIAKQVENIYYTFIEE